MTRLVLAALLLAACGADPVADAGVDAPIGADDAGLDDGGAGDAGSNDAGRDAAAPLPCAWDDLRPPPASVFWPDVLNATGARRCEVTDTTTGAAPSASARARLSPGSPSFD